MQAEEQDQSECSAHVQLTRLARVGDRVFAVLLDFVLLLPLFWLVIATIAVANGVYRAGEFKIEGGPALLSILLITFIWLAYYVITEFYFSGSPGKRVMGIAVLSEQGRRMSLAQSILRNLIRPADAIGFYGLGFVVALCSKERQRLGDMAAHTFVFEQQESRRVLALAILAAFAVAGYGTVSLFQHLVR